MGSRLNGLATYFVAGGRNDLSGGPSLDLNFDGRYSSNEQQLFLALDRDRDGFLSHADPRIGASDQAGLTALQAVQQAGREAYAIAYDQPSQRHAMLARASSAFSLVAGLAPPNSKLRAAACYNYKAVSQYYNSVSPPRGGCE